jgi:sortase (surface protein transpeptidase)
LFLILCGGLYLGLPHIQAAWQRHEGERQNAGALQAVKNQIVAVRNFTLQNPVLLQIPRLNITLSIKQGVYNSTYKNWPLDRSSAFVMQPWLDQNGMQLPETPVIYGHDIPAVFMHLSGVAPNEILVITQQDGTRYTLRYVDDVVVDPHDNSVFKVRYTDSVLLMTCTGTHFESRRVLRFELVGKQQQAAQGKVTYGPVS